MGESPVEKGPQVSVSTARQMLLDVAGTWGRMAMREQGRSPMTVRLRNAQQAAMLAYIRRADMLEALANDLLRPGTVERWNTLQKRAREALEE